MHKDNDKIIMGIDPGTNIMGYGIIKASPAGIKAIQLGVLHLSQYSNHAIKLGKIYNKTIELIKEYLPDEMAIEAPFFGKNVQSMLKLGRVQGVVIATAISRDIPIVEYAPRKIKQVVTGNGNASKEQVARMLVQTLSNNIQHPTSNIKHQTSNIQLDATDALAVAVCHYFQFQAQTNKKRKAKSWESFIKENPGRIKSFSK